MLRWLRRRAACPVCGTSLLWRGLRRTQKYDAAGKRWFQYVGPNQHCPHCDARLEYGPLYRWTLIVVVIAHLAFMSRVLPGVNARFGMSVQGWLVIAAWGALLLALLWCGRSAAGLRRPR